jgi:hypothetical protein
MVIYFSNPLSLFPAPLQQDRKEIRLNKNKTKP